VLLKSRQERSKALFLLLDHADDYGPKIVKELSVRTVVLDPQDGNSLHEELIQVGGEDSKKLEALE
jgi:hypothetical protein